jgi:hypothetical protein
MAPEAPEPGPDSRPLYEPAPGLLLRRWGESADIVFVPGLNSTHLVDAVAGEVIARLQTRPHSSAALAESSAADNLDDLLSHLLNSGLVREHLA